MTTEVVQIGAVIAGVWLVVLLLNVLSYRRAHAGSPPPRPEWLRDQFARRPVSGAIAYGVTALFFLPLLVPGVLLIALGGAGAGRLLGVALAAWAVGQFALGIWRGRPDRRKAYETRLLADSQSFWSRPDAEERARRMRAVSPFSRNR